MIETYMRENLLEVQLYFEKNTKQVKENDLNPDKILT